MSKSLDFLKKKRGLPCLVCGGAGEPHHLKPVGMGRNRSRPMMEHYLTVPLCRTCHTELHTIGLRKFEIVHSIELWRVVAMNLAEYLFARDE